MNDRGLFAITAASTVIQLGPDRRGTATFTVSNISGHAVRGRARFVLLGGGDPGWFAVAGPADRDFAAGGTHQYLIQVSVPSDAPRGSYRFRLDMSALPDSAERPTSGPPVAFTVEASGVPVPADGRGCIPWATVLRWLARRREV